MKEFTITARETTIGNFYIRANTEEEAMQKFKEMTIDGGYRDMMEDVESFDAQITGCSIIDGKEINTYYCPEGDITFIMEFTYKHCEMIAEQVIGFYYGEPDEKTTQIFKDRGVFALHI
jgi:hypothetical protein